MTSTGIQWKASSAGVAIDNKNEECTASSVSNVFNDMLNVNEDMITAAVECQVGDNIEGLIAYQRILHRDLMEMAEFIDSMFGVYSNANSSNSLITSSTLLPQNKSAESESHVVDLTAEIAEDKAIAFAVETSPTAMANRPVIKKAPRGALLTAIEAGEKFRETRRSKEQWIKSRHQVLEEEGVSAIMNKPTTGMFEAANAQSGEKEPQQGSGGLALANQLRAHQHIAAFLQNIKENAAPGPPMSMNLMFANQLAMHPTASPVAVPGPDLQVPPTSVATIASAGKKIKPSAAENSFPKIALPPAHSMYNMLFAFPEPSPLMFYQQAIVGFMPIPPWQQQLPTALPACTPAKKPQFKRMCESCRKRHFSVRQCRLVLQHTDPEWQPVQTNRRRRRKQTAINTTYK
ncbi:unnamed protein product [Peronospora belbahrii]|uniref:Uncharacterized protein n=1 Tax=Peronospora belbahrii TaxID=622444 RepID=A0ABN8CMD7_9STRA|nr:unnamed protein product [Peronospora belbahrii]